MQLSDFLERPELAVRGLLRGAVRGAPMMPADRDEHDQRRRDEHNQPAGPGMYMDLDSSMGNRAIRWIGMADHAGIWNPKIELMPRRKSGLPSRVPGIGTP